MTRQALRALRALCELVLLTAFFGVIWVSLIILAAVSAPAL